VLFVSLDIHYCGFDELAHLPFFLFSHITVSSTSFGGITIVYSICGFYDLLLLLRTTRANRTGSLVNTSIIRCKYQASSSLQRLLNDPMDSSLWKQY